ncbi:hypothetical protein C8Q78DRAFT_1067924 [Trametes maxima]|nr:hypothetical protein C8Q78DRAFT_1067924 [Trametes maxima]
MSSREPMWYCHECHAEMRPLMIPDPHCASCNGTFVEKIENPADDPRGYQLADGDHWDDGALPGNMDPFLMGLQSLLSGANASPLYTSTARATSPTARRSSGEGPRSPTGTSATASGRSERFNFRVERTSAPGGGTRTFVMGNTPSNMGGGEIPRLSQFAPRNTDGTQQDRPNITGAMLAQYLLTLLGPRRAGDPFSEFLGGMFGAAGMPPGAESGRWGDYVFNQEALDQIISQIMENSNAHQPVPATEEAIEKLPREVLEEGSPLLDKDCAVCKETFKLETEDPDDQIVISLPCKHPFHENCIMPWLKNSGTCPVCRYQLVPQPESHSAGPNPPQSSSGGPSSSSGSRSADSGGAAAQGGGLLQNVLHYFAGSHAQEGPDTGNGSSSGNGSTSATRTSFESTRNTPSNAGTGSRNTPSSRRNTGDRYDVPGGWGDEID